MSREKEDKNKDQKVKKKNYYSLGDMLRRQRNLNRSKRLVDIYRFAIVAFIFIIIAWFMLSGKVNQRLMLEKWIDKGMEISTKISEFVINLFDEDKSPVKLTEEGVYLK